MSCYNNVYTVHILLKMPFNQLINNNLELDSMRMVEAFASHRSNKFYVGIIINKALRYVFILYCFLDSGFQYGVLGRRENNDEIKETEKLLYQTYCPTWALRSSKETTEKKQHTHPKRVLYFLYDYKQIDYGLIS